jgi:hypothetical protein
MNDSKIPLGVLEMKIPKNIYVGSKVKTNILKITAVFISI